MAQQGAEEPAEVRNPVRPELLVMQALRALRELALLQEQVAQRVQRERRLKAQQRVQEQLAVVPQQEQPALDWMSTEWAPLWEEVWKVPRSERATGNPIGPAQPHRAH